MGAAGASSAASGLGDLAVYEGRFSEAVRDLRGGSGRRSGGQKPGPRGDQAHVSGFAHARGSKAAGIAAADSALQNGKSMPVRFLAARVFVEAGAHRQGEALAAPLSSDLAAEPHAHGQILEGQIALASGNAREAIRILGEANGILDTWFGHFDLGRAYLAAGGPPEADTEFDRCIDAPRRGASLMDEGPTYGHFPFLYYFQGRVREAQGDASFAESYKTYLGIRGASTDDPLVSEVRRRMKS